MTMQTRPTLTRRNALKLGASFTGGMLAASTIGVPAAFADASSGGTGTAPSPSVCQQIESIVQAKGKISNGVLSISLDRKDLPNVTLHGYGILPSFQLDGSLVFQNGENGSVMMNADMALKAGELDPFIKALIGHDIAFQAEHQHLYDLSPLVWFVHFRGMGDPQTLARGIKAALDKTSTPFPQEPNPNPTTTLPAGQIGQIIGAKPSVGDDGVVKLHVPRAETMRLGGKTISPFLNVESAIAFEPLPGGKMAAAVPDFGMIASEINQVVGAMLDQGWDSGCLYNQETDEQPQLYFDHFFKAGDPIQLAHEIRNGLNHMNVKLQ